MRLQPSLPKPKRPKKFWLTLRRVQGDSMRPALLPGKIVLARYTQTVRLGQVVIVVRGQVQIIKRVDKIQDSRLFLLGDNPAASTDSRSFGWVDKAAIVGVVVWPRRIMKP